MNQIKSLKLKIKNSNMLLEQKRVIYLQSKAAVQQESHKLMVPLLCLGIFASTFILALKGKFSTPTFAIGKNIAMLGLNKVLGMKIF